MTIRPPTYTLIARLETDRDEVILNPDTVATIVFNATPTGWTACLTLASEGQRTQMVMKPDLRLDSFDRAPPQDGETVNVIFGTDETVMLMYGHRGSLQEYAACRNILRPFTLFMKSMDCDDEPDPDECADPAPQTA